MAYVIDYELLEKLDEKVGKESELDKKSESLAHQKKLELKDELVKELATKADLILIKTELEAKIEKEVLKLDKKFTIMFLILAFLVIFINKDAVELLIKLLPFVK
jgi:hypothetical protein